MLYLVGFGLLFFGFCAGWFACSIVVAGKQEDTCMMCVMAREAVLEDAE